ncbi:MAG: hypothetical protein AAGA23_02970 [Pseudomonadota bacterium]
MESLQLQDGALKLSVQKLFFAVLLATVAATAQASPQPYQVDYDVEFQPAESVARVRIAWGPGAERIRRLELLTHERMKNFESNRPLRREAEHLVVEEMKDGTTLSYDVIIDSVRSDGKYDARLTTDWALWRGDDLIPAARVRQLVNTEAEAYLRLRGPAGWSFAAPYPRDEDGRYRIVNPDRSFDRPTGWMVGGRIGVRTERIAGIRTTVAGPVEQGIRRMDLLAFLNWTLPSLTELLPEMPTRLLLVSAREGMWRGGLSAANSLYLHADRPLISGNGTSTVLHELVHVASGLKGQPGGDWIVEGFAEYYSLTLLLRSGTITEARYRRALKHLTEWSAEAGPLDAPQSRGATTARAVLVLRDLDREIRERTEDDASLDDVLRRLVASGRKVSLVQLREAQQVLTGRPSTVLTDHQLGLTGAE